ncbi:MAG: hypothetical protein LC635_03590 [Pseudonocardiaceae bacterium]|nr:hypothetical protein [Pseudonocardiaceae bacterium]
MTERVRTVDRVASGVAAAFGAGLFLGLAPAASLAGRWLLIGLLLAATLAVLSAVSTSDKMGAGSAADGSAVDESAGGGSAVGVAAAAAVGVFGRLAVGVAVGGTFGAYVLPARPGVAAVGLVVVVVAVVLLVPGVPGVVERIAAVVVLAVLAVVAVACLAIAPVELPVAPPADAAGADVPAGALPAAALWYVCFAGAGRPVRRERLAVIAIVFAACLAVAVGVLRQLGGERLALSSAPLRDVLAAADASAVDGLLTVGVTVACGFALRGVLRDIGDLVPALGADRSPVVAVGLAAGLVALGSALLDPVVALVGGAVLLLGEAGIRVVAGRRDRAQ